MPRDIEHIVDAAHDPEITVRIAVRAVAGDVVAIAELLPVSAEVARVVAPDGPQHCGPGPANHEIPALVRTRHRITALIDDVGLDARERLRARARLRRCDTRNRRDHDGASLCLPPGIDDRAALCADDTVIPDPGFRIDRLTDASQESQL